MTSWHICCMHRHTYSRDVCYRYTYMHLNTYHIYVHNRITSYQSQYHEHRPTTVLTNSNAATESPIQKQWQSPPSKSETFSQIPFSCKSSPVPCSFVHATSIRNVRDVDKSRTTLRKIIDKKDLHGFQDLFLTFMFLQFGTKNTENIILFFIRSCKLLLILVKPLSKTHKM